MKQGRGRTERPLGVTIIAVLHIAVGVLGFSFPHREFLNSHAFGWDAVAIELTEFLALLFGVFLLRGHNWARGGALGWMLFHVILSASHAFHEFALHAVFCVVIAWLLFRHHASRYFRRRLAS